MTYSVLNNPTLYASPYLVATPQGYTKHYYAETERITSQIGKGQLSGVGSPVVSDSLVQVKLQAVTANIEHPEGLTVPTNPRFAYLDTLTNRQDSNYAAYWYHPDHLGSSSWITYTDGSAVQHLYYLPWGEDFVDQRTTNWHALHTFSAKEKDSETGLSYFSARYYSSDLSIWLSVDPMSDKYPSLSPYVYCANNPVKLVDPEGEQWETDDDKNKAQSLILKAQNQVSTNYKSINRILNKETLSNRDKETLSELIHQNEYLSEGIANLTDMGNSTEETFHFNNLTDIDKGCVHKRQDGVIDIIHSDDAMAWHECVHFGDYKKDPNWNFDSNGFLGTSPENYAAAELKAYESQFSFDNNSLKYSNGPIVQSLSRVKYWVEFHGLDVK